MFPITTPLPKQAFISCLAPLGLCNCFCSLRRHGRMRATCTCSLLMCPGVSTTGQTTSAEIALKDSRVALMTECASALQALHQPRAHSAPSGLRPGGQNTWQPSALDMQFCERIPCVSNGFR